MEDWIHLEEEAEEKREKKKRRGRRYFHHKQAPFLCPQPVHCLLKICSDHLSADHPRGAKVGSDVGQAERQEEEEQEEEIDKEVGRGEEEVLR